MPSPIIFTVVLIAVLAATAYLGFARGCMRQKLEEEEELSARWFLNLFLVGALLICVVFWTLVVLGCANRLFRMAIEEPSSIFAGGGADYFKVLAWLALTALARVSYAYCYRLGVNRIERYWRSHIKPMTWH